MPRRIGLYPMGSGDGRLVTSLGPLGERGPWTDRSVLASGGQGPERERDRTSRFLVAPCFILVLCSVMSLAN